MLKPPVIAEAIPLALKQRDQWACWKFIERHGKRTKCPYHAKFHWKASSVNPQTWCSYDAAWIAYQRSGYDGIAYMFSEDDPFCGIDLDDCLDEQGNLLWGNELLELLDSYTEISPSGRGLKLFVEAKKPEFARCKAQVDGHDIEIYDRNRMFCVTGIRFEGVSGDVQNRQAELDRLCAEFWPAKKMEQPVSRTASQRCLKAILQMQIADHADGSHRLYSACCRAVEHDLTDAEAIACLREFERIQPFPKPWTDEEIMKRLRDAEGACTRGAARSKLLRPEHIPIEQLILDYPELREPVIHGLLRQGETMNVIASPKFGKSWLVTDLCLALATGRPWLDLFQTEQGRVLILDNELHRETSAYRIPKVASARGSAIPELASMVRVENLRGRLRDIFAMAEYFDELQPGEFKVIVIDAFYRFMPRDSDENDNGTMANVYNALDAYAGRLGCSFILIHHSTKGNQSGKSVTDVGAGAGSQSRATDTHLVLRPHEEPNCAVLDAAVRSWPPIEPRVLRWQFPLWVPEPSFDPADLRSDRPRRKPKPEAADTSREPAWNAQRFADEFVSADPASMMAVIDAAVEAGLSERRANRLLKQAEGRRLVYRWRHEPVQFSTIPQMELSLA
jgi:hypothetical protein